MKESKVTEGQIVEGRRIDAVATMAKRHGVSEQAI